MRRATVAAIAITTACHGGESSPPPPTGCPLELHGNYVESTTTPRNCPTLAHGAGATNGDVLLQFELPSPSIHAHIAVTIDLGPAPTPGSYNSGTTTLWSASATRAMPRQGACLFIAGNNATPAGDFALMLDGVDRATAHGTLMLRMYVLPRVADNGDATDCGRGSTEELSVRF